MRLKQQRFIVFAVCGLASAAAAQATVRVPDVVTCARCTILEQSTMIIGADDGPGSLDGATNTIRVDSKGRFWINPVAGAPQIFDGRGRFIRALGPKGQGPGEYTGAIDIASLTADTTLVFDRRGGRAVLVAPDLTAVKTYPVQWMLGPFVSVGNRMVVASSMIGTPADAGFALHVLDFSGDMPSIAKSFGGQASGKSQLSAANIRALTWSLAAGIDGTLWTCEVTHYACANWGRDGQLRRRLERTAVWFGDSSTARIGTPEMPPSPQIIDVSVDGSGMLWVVGLAANKDWKSAWPTLQPGTRDVSANRIDVDKLYSTVIEVIDPVAGQLIARSTVPGRAMSAFSGGRVAFLATDRDGIAHVLVKAFRLVH